MHCIFLDRLVCCDNEELLIVILVIVKRMSSFTVVTQGPLTLRATSLPTLNIPRQSRLHAVLLHIRKHPVSVLSCIYVSSVCLLGPDDALEPVETFPSKPLFTRYSCSASASTAASLKISKIMYSENQTAQRNNIFVQRLLVTRTAQTGLRRVSYCCRKD